LLKESAGFHSPDFPSKRVPCFFDCKFYFHTAELYPVFKKYIWRLGRKSLLISDPYHMTNIQGDRASHDDFPLPSFRWRWLSDWQIDHPMAQAASDNKEG